MSSAPTQHASEQLRGNLLVVDDEPFVLSYLSRTLRAAGHQLVTAEDGTVALRHMQHAKFDVILSDLSMPGLDGVALLRAVRAQDLDVPVVLLTGNPDLSSAMNAVQFGAFRYLTKPIRDGDLHGVIQEALQIHQAARQQRHAFEVFNRERLTAGAALVTDGAFSATLESLFIAFQPIVRPSEKGVFAYEALMRSKTKELPNPNAVLLAAERLNRLPELGRRIRSLLGSTLETQPDLTLFVNLHAADLLDPDLYDETTPFSRHARRVVLELTERAALDNVPDLRQCLERLRKLGFRIAVDDLGAGYAGLSSFVEVAPDFVKVDISLVKGIHADPVRQRLVRSMCALCRDMGISVVAEGVELAEERDALISIGCDLLQGYLFARPAQELPPVRW